MTGRTALVTAGAFALAMLGFAVVAKADEPGEGPIGPDEEDCDTLEAAKTNRQNARNQLAATRNSINNQMQAAADAGDEQALAQLAGQLQQVNNAIANADADIADLNTRLQECS